MKLTVLAEIRKLNPSYTVVRRSFVLKHNLFDKESGKSGNDGHIDKSRKVETLLNEALTTVSSGSEDIFPSDKTYNLTEAEKRKEHLNRLRDPSRHSFRPKVDSRQTSLLLFPGQGSQFVGMSSSLLKYPNVGKMFKIASEILGYNLLDVCVNGPASKLNKTMYCQPAVVVASLAAVEKLREENPHAIESCISAAGFSVGEFAALVFADALSFEDAIEVIKVRASAMQKASEIVDSGLMTVFLGPRSQLSSAMITAKQYCSERLGIEDPVCQVANYLCTEYKVIGGHSETLAFIEENKADFGIKRTKRLPVSGAFHTKLMESAMPPLTKVLKRVDLQVPIIPVHSNLDSLKYRNVVDMRKHLVRQVKKPVKWEQIIHVLYSRTQGQLFPNTYEVGPGRVLGTLLKQTNLKAYGSYSSIDV